MKSFFYVFHLILCFSCTLILCFSYTLVFYVCSIYRIQDIRTFYHLFFIIAFLESHIPKMSETTKTKKNIRKDYLCYLARVALY